MGLLKVDASLLLLMSMFETTEDYTPIRKLSTPSWEVCERACVASDRSGWG